MLQSPNQGLVIVFCLHTHTHTHTPKKRKKNIWLIVLEIQHQDRLQHGLAAGKSGGRNSIAGAEKAPSANQKTSWSKLTLCNHLLARTAFQEHAANGLRASPQDSPSIYRLYNLPGVPPEDQVFITWVFGETLNMQISNP